jgi:hypothetical protein
MVRFLLAGGILIAAGFVLIALYRSGGEAEDKTTTFTWCGLQVDVPEPLWVAPAGDPENPVLQIWDAEANSRLPTIMNLSGEVSAPRIDGSAPIEGVALSARAQGVADSLRPAPLDVWPWVADTAGTERRTDIANYRAPHPEAGLHLSAIGESFGLVSCASELYIRPDGIRVGEVIPAEREAFDRWASDVVFP